MPAKKDPRAEPCWVDLLTSDVDGASKFYSELFGWEMRQDEELRDQGYAEVYLDGQMVTDFIANDPDSEVPDAWTTYLNVTDVHAAVYATKLHGGSVYLKPLVIPGLGSMAIIGDPAGAGVGLFQGFQATDSTVSLKHGTRVWNELHTKHFDTVAGFYRVALGWCLSPVSDTDEFRYHTYGQGSEAVAGLFDISSYPDSKAGWRAYFAVQDADETVALAEQLGGTVIHEPHDSYFGRMAVLGDTTGAEFAIIQPPQK
ncbi:VOC family protein [Glutamicibacter arilaitensis]|uniref:VOC family protein n=1 Tax=Glutamicibacter arilaitensis TaxID=256701 RepID=UPI003A8F65DB